MRDYPFSFNELKDFSESTPYLNLDEPYKGFFDLLKKYEGELNFPAIRDDVGSMINFFFKWHLPKKIFEFGSGYGQSTFWYLLNNNSIEEIILTEKRDDLESIFESLPWPRGWKEKIKYHQQDAFEVIQQFTKIDFLLIDGVKADYLRFLNESYNRLNPGALVLIDNSYWRGSFLDETLSQTKRTAKNIKELHEYIAKTDKFESVFLPYEDGVSLLRKI